MLLTQWLRFFYSDNGTVTDLSLDLNKNGDVTIPGFVAAQDYFYVFQNVPFNNLFFEIGATPQAASSSVQVELWDGNQWKAAVDILDSTKASGATLAEDGMIQFNPDRDEFWDIIEDTREEETSFELRNDVVLFDQYVARLSFTADLTTNFTLKKVGYCFATDEQLTAIDPEIDNYLTSWASGKTDWVEQIMLASLHLIGDLKSRQWIADKNQIIRFDDVSLPTAYRTLALIYNKLGPGFDPQRDDALKQYNDLLSAKRMTFDSNMDAELDRYEYQGSIAKGVR